MSWIRDFIEDSPPMTGARWAEMAIACITAIVLALLVTILIGITIHERAHGQERPKVDWSQVDTDPLEREWYKVARMPDTGQLCCGEADAYWADTFEVQGDKYVAIITDTRPDAERGRVHRPVGTRVVVPNHKIKRDQPNPLGHGVIFLSPNFPVDHPDAVYCYFVPGAG
jgi:hypothetical protein